MYKAFTSGQWYGLFGPPNPAAIGCYLAFPAGVAESDSIGFSDTLPTHKVKN